MRRKLLWFIPILFILTTLYLFVFNWLVPKTAGFTTPVKWRMIPLRQPRSIVRGYLGDPSPRKTADTLKFDQWSQGSKDKMYILRIDYGMDTIATGFSIHYVYSNRIASRDYLIDSSSIR